MVDEIVYYVDGEVIATEIVQQFVVIGEAIGPRGPEGPQGPGSNVPGPGVAPGGTTGQFLTKLSNANYDTMWQTLTKSSVGLNNVDNTSDINKPVSTAQQNALNLKIDISQIGVSNGVAGLGGDGRVPASQLPSYLDDVLEFPNFSAFPVSGTTGIIYLADDTGKIYRWSGSTYIEISANVAGGNTNNIQYNVAGVFTGSDNFTYDGTTQTINNPGAAATFPDAILLTNTTPATSGTQQAPGAIHWSGNGFGVTPQTSQSVDYKQYISVTSGSASPSSIMKWDYSLNGGTYNAVMQVTAAGVLTIQGAIIGGASGSTAISFGASNVSNFVSVASNHLSVSAAAAPRYMYAGNTTGIAYRNAFAGANATLAITTGNNYANTVVGAAPLTIAGSNLPFASNLAVTAIGAFSSTTGVVAKSTALYVGAAATFGTANYSAYIEGLTNIVTTGAQLRLAYDDTNFATFTTNNIGILGITSTGNGIDLASMPLYANDIRSSTGTNNVRLQLLATGFFAVRNVADANPALTVQQANASSTGNIANFSNSGGIVANISQGGSINGNSLNVTSGITQTGANFNLYIPSAFNPLSVGTAYSFGGAATQFIRTGFYGNGTANLTTGANFGAVVFASTPIATFTSGTHPVVANVVIKAPGPATNNGASITTTAALYVDGASTDGTNNFGIYSVSGGNVFLGGIQSGSTFTTSNFASSGTSVVTTTNANALFGGATNVSGRIYMNSGTASTLTAGVSYANLLVGSVPVTKAATGTHNILANVMVGKMGTIGGTGSTINNVVSFYVDGPGTGGTNNYTAWFNNGVTRVGAIQFGAKTVTANTTYTDDDEFIFADTTAGNITLTLPTAIGKSGRKYDAVKTVAANVLNFATTLGQTINGATPGSVTAIGTTTFISDGANWYIG